MTSDVQAVSPATGADSHAPLLSGTRAIVEVVVQAMERDHAAGRNTAAFVSGYPGSPLGTLDQELRRQRARLDAHGIVHLPGHNEELAATAVSGSQSVGTFPGSRHDGVLGVWYGKAPGLDRAVDAIRHAQFAGTSPLGGVLALVGDDPECKSSTIPSSSERTLIALDMPVLYPGTVSELVELGRLGVELSRTTGLWVALRIVTGVADSFMTVDASADIAAVSAGVPDAPTFTPLVRTPALPDSLDAEREVQLVKLPLAARFGVRNRLNRVTVSGSADRVAMIAAGRVYHELVGALRSLGLDETALRRHGVRLVQVRMLHPMDSTNTRELLAGVQDVVVVEEKAAVLEDHVRQALFGTASPPTIHGRWLGNGEPGVRGFGALSADAIAETLRTLLPAILPEVPIAAAPGRRALPLIPLQRSPYFCSGCPHSSSLRVPDNTLVGVGIGCHGMVSWTDPAMVGTVVTKPQMGGEGASWLGIEPFVADRHFVQNIGDGTYFHSAQLAVQAAVAAGSHLTFKLLVNGAIAMTGGQNPSTSNARSVADVARVLLAQGVTRVAITTEDRGRYRRQRLPRGVGVFDRSRILDVQEELRRLPGVTVLIHDQECAAEKRRKRRRGLAPRPPRQIHIVDRVCEGCGDCGRASNCLSLESIDTEFGPKTAIDQHSCNQDYLCVDGECPSFVSITRRKARRRPTPANVTRPDVAGIPRPSIPDVADFSVRMFGIGGTGVVTVNRVVATAARLAGFNVAGLDQTGMSQKAGPVVSDVRLSRAPLSGPGRTEDGELDLVLGFDAVVTASNPGASASMAAAVVSTHMPPIGPAVPTGANGRVDADEVLDALRAAYGENLRLVDSVGLVDGLLGDSTYSYVFMLGAAVQWGLLPLAPETVEEAIAVGGVAVDSNVDAFRFGRLWAADPDTLAAREESEPVERVSGLEGLVSPELARRAVRRADDLEQYQDRGYAARYLDVVRTLAESEARRSDPGMPLTSAVVDGLHKVMAYKDEYEVARLHLAALPNLREANPGARVTWHLQPPLLALFGVRRKIAVGERFAVVYRALRGMRRLRGTWLDPFGHTEVRRRERDLARLYERDMRRAAELLTGDRFEALMDLARLPEIVRGYESVKLSALARYDEERSRLWGSLGVAPERVA